MTRQRTLWLDSQVHFFLLIPALLLILIPLYNKTPSETTTRLTAQAAVHFLHLVDGEEYERSWDVSSHALKELLSREAWSEKLGQIREMLGPLIERSWRRVTYTDSADNVPPGEYVVITFTSKFRLREYVTETITLLLDNSGQWKVAGYFLR